MSDAADMRRRLRLVADDLAAACGVQVVWKDADPAWWPLTPAGIGQHRNAHCLAVKADPTRHARCIAVDHGCVHEAAERRAPWLRTCPFGVTELIVPVRHGDQPEGCLFIGPWHRGKGHRGRDQIPPGLVPFPGVHAARAIGRLALDATRRLAAERAGLRAMERAWAAGDPLMAEAAAWIDAHLSAALRAPQVAAAVHLSASRFVHRFKEATGTPFGPHLRARLMQEAARRLSDPGLRVIDVSLALGFANQNWFATAFRKHHGCTPSAWRKRAVE